MELYLIRHGIAEEKGTGIPDEERQLTKEGRQKTEKVAQYLKKLDFKFDLILTSPLTRAAQTAEILIKYGLANNLEESAHLSPQGHIYTWVVEWLEPRNYPADRQLALVGHEPCLSDWASILIWGQAKGGILLKKAGMIGLKLPENASPLGCSQMFWLTPPKYLP